MVVEIRLIINRSCLWGITLAFTAVELQKQNYGSSRSDHFAGGSIIVSLETFEGAVSKLLGSVTDKIFNRDSLYVMPFICQKM